MSILSGCVSKAWFQRDHSPSRIVLAKGFTLIELVMVIAITGIIAAAIGQLIGGQMASYQNLTERAALVQMAQNAIRRMERDIHHALPYSVQITNGGNSIAVLNVAEGTRYRLEPRLDKRDIAAILNGVSQTTPIVVTTTVAHGFATGDKVTIKDIYDTAASLIAFRNEANPWTITVIDGTHFSLDGSVAPANPYDETAPPGYTEKVLGDPLSFATGVFSCPDATFDVVGNLAVSTADNIDRLWVVVRNANEAGQDAWAGVGVNPPQANVAVVTALAPGGSDDGAGSDRLTISNLNLTSGLCAFPRESDGQRLYFVDRPIQFTCPGDGTLLKVIDYLAAPPYWNADPLSTLLATQVASCNFSVSTLGNNPPLVTISLTLTSPSGESVNITSQASIDNGI
ncbi:MAG: prepilin-type N-terminal cleavage/methylation domain-containing protein [Methylococcaceae bacterium]|nr:MAG: prepilin-type N-terminal cleavage/methylation domain-containing protein [Methylococcaceae bacterium]